MSENPKEVPTLQYPSVTPDVYYVWPVIWSTSSFVSGLICCPSGLALPICGLPVVLVGIVSGVVALVLMRRLPPNALVKFMAIIGLVLSCVGMLITIANAAWGVYMATHPATAPAPLP